MAYYALGRILRPQSFLYLMSLRSGTELVVITMLINKVTGVYGILALLTGYHLSPLQLSMYIYSILALVTTIILGPHIRKQTPLQCLAFAWFYLLDSLVNAAYTAAFAVSWFLVLAQHTASMSSGTAAAARGLTDALGGDTIADTAGFTNPEHNVTHVDVHGPTPTGLVGHNDGDAAAAGGVLESTIFQSGSVASIVVVCLLSLIRLYFILVALAYARGVLRQSIVASSATQGTAPVAPKAGGGDGGADAMTTPHLSNPFSALAGWQGKLGRAMTWFPRAYWFGPDNDGDARWMREMGRKLDDGRRASTGLVERERRRRAGTGPPQLKPLEMDHLNK